MSSEEQAAFLDWLARGASPFGVCQQLGASLASYNRTLAEDVAFQQAVAEVVTVLSQNVLSALYQTAMKGNVAAQRYWLETRPPPGWSNDAAQAHHDAGELVDGLSDLELVELARAMGIAVPPELEEKARRAGPERFADGVSPATSARGR